MAKAEAEGDGTSEPLNCKTWVLRVSLHCEGCKRKVKRILQNINGVHGVEIDLKQHKVTVTTFTDAETLIKKLAKAGKHAEPWPEKKPSSKPVKHKPATASETTAGETTAEKKKQPAETEAPLKEVQDPSKNEEKSGTSGNVEAPEISKGGEGGGGASDNNGGSGAERVEESPPEVKQTPTLQNATQSLEDSGGKSNAGETLPGGPKGAVLVEVSGGGGGGGGGSGGEGKKKKKKAQKKGKSGGVGGGVEVVTQTIPAPANTGSSPPLDHHDQILAPNRSPPRNDPYHYPVHTFVSQPAYVASCNTAHPSSSYGPYYASQPPYSYAYVHSAVPRNISPPSPPPQAAEQSNSPPSNPFDFFSDENPSGCSVM